jgi:hypothetical protein
MSVMKEVRLDFRRRNTSPVGCNFLSEPSLPQMAAYTSPITDKRSHDPVMHRLILERNKSTGGWIASSIRAQFGVLEQENQPLIERWLTESVDPLSYSRRTSPCAERHWQI